MSTAINGANPDAPPPKELETGPWSKYLWLEKREAEDEEGKPKTEYRDNPAKLFFNGYFYKVNSVFGLYYLLQFVLSLAAANFYSDSDRFISCGIENYNTPMTSSAGLDTALYLLAIYHITEWLRTTVLLVISCTGTPITVVYYVTALNCVFGFVAYIFTYVTYFSEVGSACAKAQEYRGKFLLAEVILFWVLFIPFLFPPGILLFCGK